MEPVLTLQRTVLFIVRYWIPFLDLDFRASRNPKYPMKIKKTLFVEACTGDQRTRVNFQDLSLTTGGNSGVFVHKAYMCAVAWKLHSLSTESALQVCEIGPTQSNTRLVARILISDMP